MPKNDIETLRTALFEQLERLGASNSPEEIARAKAVGEIAKHLTDTARVEVDMIRATGNATATGFISMSEEGPRKWPANPGMKMIDNKRSRTV